MDSNINIPILTVTGSDSTGGAGIQSDIKTIVALGGYAVSAITSVTVQNTLGIQDFFDLPADTVTGQLEAIMDDVQPVAVKVGMLRSVPVVRAVEDVLLRYAPRHVVYNPMAVSTNGDELMSADVAETIKRRLVRLCSLVVLNREAAQFFLHKTVDTQEQLADSARQLLDMGCKAVLLLGGQLFKGSHTDMLFTSADAEPLFFSSAQAAAAVHGQGSILSTAIATYMAQGYALGECVAKAKSYINQQTAYVTHLHGRSAELYNQFIDLVAAHARNSSDVGFYADRLNVSSRYLSQVTRRIADKTPKAMIDDYLMQQAKTLLEDGAHTVQEVAYELGFKQQSHFTVFFRKQEGIAPSKYKDKRP